jgi:hypothetical protein
MLDYDIDSFGNRVKVGDFVYFRSKVKWAPDAMSIGVVVKMTGKSISLRYINTHNMTLEDHIVAQRKDVEQMRKLLADPKASQWTLEHYPDIIKAKENNPFCVETTRLASASSMVKVPDQAVSVQLRQVLDQEDFADGIL